jgi:hypothetical protein
VDAGRAATGGAAIKGRQYPQRRSDLVKDYGDGVDGARTGIWL